MYKCVKSIDPALLIEEVKKRQLLYDSRAGVVCSERRRSSWYEICEIFIQNFRFMSRVEKENICREMQSRWKALRDSYRRTMRLEERDKRLGLNPSRRTKYYYFDQLSFLAEHCGPKGGKYKQEEDNSDHQDSNGSATMDSEDPNTYMQYHYLPVEAQVDTSLDEPTSKRVKTEETPLVLSERMVRVLEDLTDIKKKEHEDNAMGNKHFLLSLLPFMEELSNEDNLQVRVHFMNVLQTYRKATVKKED
ncbi:uncharacterized protein LOC123688617 [Harmonia axyridis]|uniref:uncharacterized protein LOC123688617 n=1 Tax=Harmonia axyridis TaxID=115357 RepID=UPI001E278343|nr:uncharacterized protein LOC123688617 [Harmonia axyridis]